MRRARAESIQIPPSAKKPRYVVVRVISMPMLVGQRIPAFSFHFSGLGHARTLPRRSADQAAVADGDRACASLRHRWVMGSDHNGRPGAFMQVVEQVEDGCAGDAVQVAGRLVGNQQRRVVDQSTRDRDALLFAAGQLGRQSIGAVAQADRTQEGGSAVEQFPFPAGRAATERPRCLVPSALAADGSAGTRTRHGAGRRFHRPGSCPGSPASVQIECQDRRDTPSRLNR
jgi:hypothetical protein